MFVRTWSSSLWNISEESEIKSMDTATHIPIPVSVVLIFSPKPMISTSSPFFATPRSARPVATVPRPETEKTSSTARRNGFSKSPVKLSMEGNRNVREWIHTGRQIHPVVTRLDKLANFLFANFGIAAFESSERRTHDNRRLLAVKVVC